MRCGAVQADITPAAGHDMSGFVARTQPSIGVHDPLAARALFIEKDGRRILWLHADILAFERDDVQILKRRLFERFGLHEHETMVTATHTHSGPATLRLFECGEYDAEYVCGLLATLERLAGEALRSTEEVKPVVAEGTCDLGLDRRGFAPGHTDHRLPVIGFRRGDGSYLAVLASYAVHGVAMGAGNRLFSADILGRAARTLSERLPGFPVVLFTNGACGNINPPGVGNDFGVMEGWGDAVAEAAWQALQRAEPAPDVVGGARIVCIVGAPYRLTSDELDATIAGRLGGDERFLRAQSRWRGAVLSGDAVVRRRVEAPFDVHGISLCGATFIGFGGEVFSTAGDAFGDRVYPISFADGDAGYLCPRHAYTEGGYEPHIACVFYGTNPIPEGVFEKAVEVATQLTAELAAEARPEES